MYYQLFFTVYNHIYYHLCLNRSFPQVVIAVKNHRFNFAVTFAIFKSAKRDCREQILQFFLFLSTNLSLTVRLCSLLLPVCSDLNPFTSSQPRKWMRSLCLSLCLSVFLSQQYFTCFCKCMEKRIYHCSEPYIMWIGRFHLYHLFSLKSSPLDPPVSGLHVFLLVFRDSPL